MTLISLIYWWLRSKAHKVDYDAYLRSRAWKFRRRVLLWLTGHKCQVCGKRGGLLDCHHNCYDHLGAERFSDLVVLCRADHIKYHGH